jgi:hypothetical protein
LQLCHELINASFLVLLSSVVISNCGVLLDQKDTLKLFPMAVSLKTSGRSVGK